MKRREYVKLPDGDYSGIRSEHLYRLPGGDYAVLTACIQDEETDFSPLLACMEDNGFTTDFVTAEELGFQLFKYWRNFPDICRSGKYMGTGTDDDLLYPVCDNIIPFPLLGGGDVHLCFRSFGA